MRRYERADAELHAGGGYAAESEAATIAHSLGITDRLLGQQLKTLSGGQRRRVELARILFSDAETLLLDEPTNHLDADSIVWLRDFLKAFPGGIVVISHDTDLLETTVNRVLHLDANRAAIDTYNIGWKAYLQQRETDEKRRKRERVQRRGEGQDAHRPGQQDAGQGHQGPGRAVDAQARRADARRRRGASGRPTRSPGSRSPSPHRAARRRSPPPSCPSPTARSRSSPMSTSRSTRARGSSSSASTAPARPRCCGSSPASTSPTPARSCPATGSSSATTRRSTRPSTSAARSWRTCSRRRPS